MTKLGFFSAAAVLSMVAATPVFADNFAQQEPAAFASTHPNVLSARASGPFGKSEFMQHAHRWGGTSRAQRDLGTGRDHHRHRCKCVVRHR